MTETMNGPATADGAAAAISSGAADSTDTQAPSQAAPAPPEAEDDSRPWLRFGALKPSDLRRARVVLGGRNPSELLEDPLEAPLLILWCLLSREDPTLTWQQMEDLTFDEINGMSPPEHLLPKGDQTEARARNGPSPNASGSKRKRRASTPKGSSAPSTG